MDKSIIFKNEYCSNIELFKKNELNKVESSKPCSSGLQDGFWFRPDKSNCRKLLKQSIICSACFCQ